MNEPSSAGRGLSASCSDGNDAFLAVLAPTTILIGIFADDNVFLNPLTILAPFLKYGRGPPFKLG